MGLLREASSREKQFSVLLVALALLFVSVYLLVFPRPLPPELSLVPVEARALADQPAQRLGPGGTFFVLGPWQGYWDAQGVVQRVEARRAQAAVSGERLAWFDAAKNQLVVEGLSGPVFTLAGEAYPFWSHGRLFAMDENRMGLKGVDAAGKVTFSRTFASLITAVDAGPQLTAVGTLDGRVQVLGPGGEAAGGFQPGGSRFPVVYNVAVSRREDQVLVLAGVEPKRFLVLQRGGAEFRPVFHKPLQENRPWPTPLGFLPGLNLAYYQTEAGLAFLDARVPAVETVVPVAGSPVALAGLADLNLVVFAQKDARQAALRLASPDGMNLLTLPFGAQEVLLAVQGQSLMLGLDQSLLRFEVRLQ